MCKEVWCMSFYILNVGKKWYIITVYSTFCILLLCSTIKPAPDWYWLLNWADPDIPSSPGRDYPGYITMPFKSHDPDLHTARHSRITSTLSLAFRWWKFLYICWQLCRNWSFYGKPVLAIYQLDFRRNIKRNLPFVLFMQVYKAKKVLYVLLWLDFILPIKPWISHWTYF